MAYSRVYGHVLKTDGTPVSGIYVRLTAPTGAIQDAMTDYAGYYNFTSVLQAAGQYTLVPYRTGVTLTPTSRTFIVDGDKIKDFSLAASTSAMKSFSGTVSGATGTSIRIKVLMAGTSVYYGRI
jgi:hypothetical protein